MNQRAMTMVAWVAIAAAPSVVGAQGTTTAIPPALAICDCPVGDARGSLRDLAAFAPLGLLGALAAAGGAAPILAARPVADAPVVVASQNPVSRSDAETPTPIVEAARNAVDPVPPLAARIGNSTVPDPRLPDAVSPDSLRGGIRAPNTGTSLPSVFLLGSGLIAIGCVAIFRSRG